MSKVIGRFYFEIDSKNNLNGKFSNNLHTTNYSEIANRLSGTGFIGDFNTEWIDDKGPFKSHLKIDLKTGSMDIYSLNWKNGMIEFFGEGIIVNNILIGDYRNTVGV